jgi:probable FeS assembly SUF system protein SufT
MPEETKNNVQTTAANEETTLDQRVWAALRECYDPEIPVNLVDLGLIYEMRVDDSIPGEANIFVRMTLTAPGCGMGPMIANDVKRRVQLVQGVKNVHVELTFDPPWNPGMMTEAAKLQLNMY